MSVGDGDGGKVIPAAGALAVDGDRHGAVAGGDPDGDSDAAVGCEAGGKGCVELGVLPGGDEFVWG